MKDDLCGVTEYPVAVIVKHPSFHLPRTEPLNADLGKGIKNKDAQKIKQGGGGGGEDGENQDGAKEVEAGKNVPMNPSGIVFLKDTSLLNDE